MLDQSAESFWQLISKDRFSKLKDLALKYTRCLEMRLCTLSKTRQGKSKKSNWMADETLDDSLRLASIDTGTNKGRIMSEEPRPQASYW